MAIRFQCGACTQPIEVDDEWASKPVLCPFCRKAITAPAQSTLPEEAAIGQASPLRDTGAVPAVPPPLPYSGTASPNHVATAALVLAVLEALFLIIAVQVIRANRLEAEEFMKAVSSAKDFAGMFEAQNEYLKARGGYPPWLMTYVMLQMAALLNWFPLVVCAIIGVTRPMRRMRAVFALVIAGLVPLLFFCGLLIRA